MAHLIEVQFDTARRVEGENVALERRQGAGF